MFRNLPRLLVLGAVIGAVALFGLAACSDQGDPTDQGCAGFPCEETWFPEDYLTNPAWSEVIACRFSSPHGPGMRVHITPASQAAFYLDRDGRDAGFPVGTTIVKTEYTTPACSGVPFRVTVMRKGAVGTAPTTGDWEWQELRYDDKTERAGILGDCLACHNGAGAGGADCGPEYDYTCIIP